MPEVKFVRQPGLLQDLSFLYVLHFNPDLWEVQFCLPERIAEDKKYYKSILEEYPEFSNDLKLFFYLKDNAYAFFTKECLHNFGLPLEEKWDFENLKSRISNVDLMVYKMLKFYVPDSVDPETEGKGYDTILAESPYINNGTYCYDQLIRETKLPDEIKFQLICFFVNPDIYIDKLVRDLDIKFALLTAYYNRNSNKILSLQENFSYVDLWENIKRCPRISPILDESETIYISYSLYNMGLYLTDEPNNLAILGADYETFIDSMVKLSKRVDMTEAGRILADKNRIKIIKFIVSADSEERTTSEIAKELGLSLNATIYHLDMMKKAGMVKSREIGRTVLYRNDKDYFRQLSKAVGQLLEHEEGSDIA